MAAQAEEVCGIQVREELPAAAREDSGTVPATDAEHGLIKQTVKAADAYGTDHTATTKLTEEPEAALLQEAAHGLKWIQIVCGKILMMYVKRMANGGMIAQAENAER